MNPKHYLTNQRRERFKYALDLTFGIIYMQFIFERVLSNYSITKSGNNVLHFMSQYNDLIGAEEMSRQNGETESETRPRIARIDIPHYVIRVIRRESTRHVPVKSLL